VIFVGGMSRAGTSVMMECLKNSGYRIGEDALLNGHKYKSEYKPLFFTFEWMYPSVVGRGGKFNKIDFVIINNVAAFTLNEGVEAVKVLKTCFMFPCIKDHSIMKHPKFILMSRNVDDAVASCKRVGQDSASPEALGMYVRGWNIMAKDYPTIRIKHKDLINNTEEVKKKLSVFLDRDIDMSIISPKETYEVSGSVH